MTSISSPACIIRPAPERGIHREGDIAAARLQDNGVAAGLRVT
ncbi:MAG: hypothetical protein RNU03_11935 [Candidatus Sedimenticola sp. (ex Thyasira tokunagai)]